MSTIRYFGVVVLTLLGVYAGLLAISHTLYPEDLSDGIDTRDAGQSIYFSDPKYLLFSADRLARPGPRVVLLGASGVMHGLRPREISPLLGGVTVDNMSIGSSNVSTAIQVVDIVYDKVPKDSWGQLTFVFGVWYNSFSELQKRWPEGMTPIDAEYLRYGLYRVDENGRLRLPLVDGWKGFLRPMLLVSRLYSHLLTDWYPRQKEKIKSLLDPNYVLPWMRDPDTYIFSSADRARMLPMLQRYMGPFERWGDSEYRELVGLAHTISSRGSRLVILDLPVAPWLREISPFHKAYQDRKKPYFRELETIPGVRYVSLQDGYEDDDFMDYSHPRPRITHLWASRAASAIAPSLEKPPVR